MNNIEAIEKLYTHLNERDYWRTRVRTTDQLKCGPAFSND